MRKNLKNKMAAQEDSWEHEESWHSQDQSTDYTSDNIHNTEGDIIDMGNKRERTWAPREGGGPPPSKRFHDDLMPSTLRVLLRSIDAGGIIGKGGENIKRLRKKYDCQVQLPDSSGNPERVLTVIGSQEGCVGVFEECLEKVKNEMTRRDANSPLEVQVLIPQPFMGTIIGTGGAKIKELRKRSSANIKIFSEPMPFSNERSISLSGTEEQIIDCVSFFLQEIGQREPKEPIILYDPALPPDMPPYDYSSPYPPMHSHHYGNKRGGRGGGRGRGNYSSFRGGRGGGGSGHYSTPSQGNFGPPPTSNMAPPNDSPRPPILPATPQAPPPSQQPQTTPPVVQYPQTTPTTSSQSYGTQSYGSYQSNTSSSTANNSQMSSSAAVNTGGAPPANVPSYQSGYPPIPPPSFPPIPPPIPPPTFPPSYPPTGYNTAPNNAYQSGTQSGYQSGAQSGYQPGAQSGYQSGTQSGYQSGAQSGTQSGYQPGAQSGYQSGTQSGYQSGMQSGYQSAYGSQAYPQSYTASGQYQQAPPTMFPSAAAMTTTYNTQSQQSTKQVTIPNEYASSILGDNGATLQHIRAQSQCNITMDEPAQGTNQRIITIVGTTNNIAYAEQLMKNSVRLQHKV